MRTTFRIDDDLMRALRGRAQSEKLSLTKLVNRLLRRGLEAASQENRRRRRYRETTFAMGIPRVDLDKALVLAAKLEDSAVSDKLSMRK